MPPNGKSGVVQTPSLETGRGGFKRFLELLVGQFVERLEKFSVVRIDALVGHALSLIQCRLAESHVSVQ
jgi:hypothetical protein